MGTAVGANTCVGIAEETVAWGTPAVVSRFYEFLSETLERRQNVQQSNAIRCGNAGYLRRGSRRSLSTYDGGGDLTMEVATSGFGVWFKHLLGAVATTGTGPYTHTFTMGSLLDKGLTVAKTLRDSASTEIETFTFSGGKILSGTFSITTDQLLQLAVSLDFKDVSTAIAAAAASFSNVTPFSFHQGTLSIDGSTAANVTSATVTVTNALKTDSYYLGSGGTKGQQVENDFRAVTGSFDAEFASSVYYDLFAADTAAELVLEFVGDTPASETLTITVPEIHVTGETPKVGGPDVVVQAVPWEGAYDGTNSGIEIVYKTADATP